MSDNSDRDIPPHSHDTDGAKVLSPKVDKGGVQVGTRVTEHCSQCGIPTNTYDQ